MQRKSPEGDGSRVQLTGFYLLFMTLLYGAGMRLQECLRLRIQEIEVRASPRAGAVRRPADRL